MILVLLSKHKGRCKFGLIIIIFFYTIHEFKIIRYVSFPHDRVIFIDIHEFKNNRTYRFYPIGLRLISTNLIL